MYKIPKNSNITLFLFLLFLHFLRRKINFRVWFFIFLRVKVKVIKILLINSKSRQALRIHSSELILIIQNFLFRGFHRADKRTKLKYHEFRILSPASSRLK